MTTINDKMQGGQPLSSCIGWDWDQGTKDGDKRRLAYITPETFGVQWR